LRDLELEHRRLLERLTDVQNRTNTIWSEWNMDVQYNLESERQSPEVLRERARLLDEVESNPGGHAWEQHVN